MNINWQDIHHFLIMAETGSLSEAARQLGTSQPTLGRRLDALEDVLGFHLFKRHARGLDLTQEGILLVEQARQMMLNAANIERLATGEGQEPEGVVRLSLPEGLCNEIIVPALGDFLRRYPKLRLLLAVSSREADLMRGEADVALRLYRPREPDLVARKLGVMTMGLYASRSYLQHSSPLLTQDDVAHHACIGYGEELQHLDENQWLLKLCPQQRLVMCSDSTSCRLKATLSGLGISIQADMIAARHDDLVRLFHDAPIPRHEIWLTYHKDLVRSHRTRLVVDMLVALMTVSVSGRVLDFPVRKPGLAQTP